MSQLLTPVPYYGAKTGIAREIVAMMGPHRHYVEPYCGSLSVLFAKPPSYLETVNDLDYDVMTFWRVLRDRPDELTRACMLTPHSRAELVRSQQIPYPVELDELERARMVYVALTQGRFGQRKSTGWHYVIEASSLPRLSVNDEYRRLFMAAERLRGVTLECLPALEIIRRYGASTEVLLYVDPPYLKETERNSLGMPRNTHGGGRYLHDMTGDAPHRELAEALHSAQATVMLSGYASDLYDRELYPDWHRQSLKARSDTQVADYMRDEIIWSNRPLDIQLDLFTLDGAP